MSDSLTEVYKDAFLRFLAEGKTHLEALREFDRQKFRAAMLAEVYAPGSGVNFGSGNTLLSLSSLADREEADEKDMEQAIELWLAGWTSELPAHYNTPEGKEMAKNDPWSRCAVMSWYWRRPPKGKRTQGRLFLSTNQAFNAMKRETPE